MSYYIPIDESSYYYSSVQPYHLTNHHLEMASPSQNSPGIGGQTNSTTQSSKATGSDSTSQVKLYIYSQIEIENKY